MLPENLDLGAWCFCSLSSLTSAIKFPESGCTILQHPLSAHHDSRSEEQPWGIKLVAGLGSQSTINFQPSTPSSTINNQLLTINCLRSSAFQIPLISSSSESEVCANEAGPNRELTILRTPFLRSDPGLLYVKSFHSLQVSYRNHPMPAIRKPAKLSQGGLICDKRDESGKSCSG